MWSSDRPRTHYMWDIPLRCVNTCHWDWFERSVWPKAVQDEVRRENHSKDTGKKSKESEESPARHGQKTGGAR